VATAGADEVDAALAGYAKALSRERSDELVKCVELRTDDGAAAMAHALFAELRSGSAAPEVRWAGGIRYEPDFAPAPSGEPIEIGAETWSWSPAARAGWGSSSRRRWPRGARPWPWPGARRRPSCRQAPCSCSGT